jgi:hypothetical protein
VRIIGRRGWKLNPFTRLLLVSNLVSILPGHGGGRRMGPSRGGGEEAGDEGGDGENAMDNLGEEMERDLGEERSTG